MNICILANGKTVYLIALYDCNGRRITSGLIKAKSIKREQNSTMFNAE